MDTMEVITGGKLLSASLLLSFWLFFIAIIKFASIQKIKNKKYVDGGKGKIVEIIGEACENYDAYKLCVECYINGVYYKQYLTNSTVYSYRNKPDFKVGMEINGIKYDINSTGKVNLYMENIKERNKMAFRFLIAGIAVMVMGIIMSAMM